MDEVKVVVAHSERATLRVGDVFLKVDADQARADVEVEVEAKSLAPVPTWGSCGASRDRRTPRDDAWTPRRAVDRGADGMGRGGRRHHEWRLELEIGRTIERRAPARVQWSHASPTG